MGVPGLAPCGAGEETFPDCNPLYDQAVTIRDAVATALVAVGWDTNTPKLVSHGQAIMPVPPGCDQLDVWVASINRVPIDAKVGTMRTEVAYGLRLAIGCWPTIVDAASGEPTIATPQAQEYAARWSIKWATTVYDTLLTLEPVCHKSTFVLSPVVPSEPSGQCATWTTLVKW